MINSLLDRCWQISLWFAYRLALCYWFIVRPNSQGAYIAVWVEDRVLIAKNSYKTRYAMPAGGLHKGETFREAAIRELREEVGIHASEADLSFYEEYPSRAEFKRDVAQLFELRLPEVPEVSIDNREVISAQFMTVEEALALPLVDAVESYLTSRQKTTN